jgi:hypothetical protein
LAQAQVLAAAVQVQWRVYERDREKSATKPARTQAMTRTPSVSILMQLLLLLAHQLQRAPPQQRAAFLGSPWGSIVLQVMSELVEGNHLDTLAVLVSDAVGQPSSQQQQQQPMVVQNAWQEHMIRGDVLLELLVLPALLLHPAFTMGAGAGALDVGSSSSSSEYGSSTMLRQPTCGSVVPCTAESALQGPASAGSSTVLAALGKGEYRLACCQPWAGLTTWQGWSKSSGCIHALLQPVLQLLLTCAVCCCSCGWCPLLVLDGNLLGP